MKVNLLVVVISCLALMIVNSMKITFNRSKMSKKPIEFDEGFSNEDKFDPNLKAKKVYKDYNNDFDNNDDDIMKNLRETLRKSGMRY